jgi:hypothetical protein
MHAMTNPVTYSTEYWTLTLPGEWRHESADYEDCFAVESEDGSKRFGFGHCFPARR